MTFEKSESSPALRRRAEEKLKSGPVAPQQVQSLDEANRLLHELLVHQIELEMQNEELRRAQLELEALRMRYFDLYDLAPVGYCALSEKGVIQEANLSAATMLGAARGDMVNRPISRYILREDQNIYYHHITQLLETGEPRACELRMMKRDGTVFWALLAAATARAPSTHPGQDADGSSVIRIVLSDISERKRAEEALNRLNEELEERVRERTKELERRNHELEVMNKSFVGRELKMAELKERINELERRFQEPDGRIK